MGWIQINCPLSLPFTPPATKLGQGNIFSSLCQEFCPQQGSAPLHAGIPPSPGADTPLDQAPPGAVHPGRYGQQAGGTHPTGMQSCLSLISAFHEKTQNSSAKGRIGFCTSR